ncbi:MAG: hypothetical protein ACOY0T_14305 [Myxococcota bacterium]
MLRVGSWLLSAGFALGVLASSGCASREAVGQSSLSILGPGVVNDPKNRSLRFDMLKFGLERFCAEMSARGLALKMSDDEPVMGRFYASACSTQTLDEETRKSFVVQYAGSGFATSPQGGRVGFSTNGLVEYSPDFLMKDGALYVYFRPRVVDATGFQTLLVESQIAAAAIKLFGVNADAFGRKVVDGQLRRGFTVVRYGSSGETDFGLGVIALGEKPYHPFQVATENKLTLVNERTEVHLGQQDYIGPLNVANDGQALYFTLKLDGAQAIDALLVSEPVGKASIDAFTKQAGPVALSGPVLLNEPVTRGALWKRYVTVPKGRYYLVLDNSAAGGRTMPPAGPADGQSARTDVLALVGDSP